MIRPNISALLTVVLSAALAHGMGADHSLSNLSRNAGWPKGFYDVVNQPSLAHGYWVNSSDTLFYRGGNRVLNKMLVSLAGIPDLRVAVVIHAGKGIAKSPWNKQSVCEADWSISTYGDHAVTKHENKARIDVWLSGNIALDELKISTSVTVTSGGEIEEFVQQHQTPHKDE